VLNRDFGYVHRVEDFEWMPGALAALARLKEAGYWVAVVTNQSGIERGYYSEEDFLALSAWMVGEAFFDAVLYCPHLTTPCPARKPGTGMLETAARMFPVDKQRSFLVGDKETDLQAASAFGIRPLPYNHTLPPLDEFLEGSISL
jgi:D-glycero-D-manno-heptose 1,7-bisphosphate phosphatase